MKRPDCCWSNVGGQRVAKLVEVNLQNRYYRLLWDSKDAKGLLFGSGIYFAKLVINPDSGGEIRVLTQRMLLMK